MKIIKEGKENYIICDNCCTEYEFEVDDIQLYDKEYYYVKCPVCGKKHFLKNYFGEKVGGSHVHFTRNKIVKMVNEYYQKHKEHIDKSKLSGDDIGLTLYKLGAEPY